jgi:hypothetical protein
MSTARHEETPSEHPTTPEQAQDAIANFALPMPDYQMM